MAVGPGRCRTTTGGRPSCSHARGCGWRSAASRKRSPTSRSSSGSTNVSESSARSIRSAPTLPSPSRPRVASRRRAPRPQTTSYVPARGGLAALSRSRCERSPAPPTTARLSSNDWRRPSPCSRRRRAGSTTRGLWPTRGRRCGVPTVARRPANGSARHSSSPAAAARWRSRSMRTTSWRRVRLRPLLAGGVESLTPSERRVAQLAAEGLTNREVAQSLFLTVKTVETHPLAHLPQARHRLAHRVARGARGVGGRPGRRC